MVILYAHRGEAEMNEQEAWRAWREILTQGRDVTPSESVFLQLCEYSGLSLDEVKEIAANSSSITAQKWAEADRSTPEGVRQFYESVSNWVFGTLSYHARQAEGDYPPLPATVAEELRDVPAGAFLDFGAGVGTASLLFDRIGWSVTAADVSAPLMDFAAWRFKHYGADIPIIDLNTQALPEGRFDVIAGFNTMAHVVDVAPTVKRLRNALKPGGLLVFDIDFRTKDQQMCWHVMDSHYPYLRIMRRLGFRLEKVRNFMFYYRRVEQSALQGAFWAVADGIRYSPVVLFVRNLKNKLRGRLSRRG
ncbi:class I SAM-dependent methyltransferase [Hyphomonas sp. WL0036]|uniref:class I SAM-dependent methyltransferase n=1 Tax=Hyphomonas sediminis TaxID=2866160 RepID=UPI001C7E38A2|nr:class I SAM-dependent methyltransferase [Hyphomonas sediminis]MBY9068468.1 class I SAM-dependent methyltransferase [Hyphomonas sediminis]